MRALRRLVAVSFCHMLVNVTGFCLGLSLFRSPRSVLQAWNSCKAPPGRLARGNDVAKSSAMVYLEPSRSSSWELQPSGAELQVAGGLIEIEFVRSASAAWESVARAMGGAVGARCLRLLREISGLPVEASDCLERRQQSKGWHSLWLARSAHHHRTRTRCDH